MKTIHQETLKKSEDETWIANFDSDVTKTELQIQENGNRQPAPIHGKGQGF